MTLLPTLFGTLPQWITAIAGAGILGALLKFRLGWRGQTLDSDEKIRDHYAKEVQRLSAKLDTQTKQFREDLLALEGYYRKMLSDSDQRHDECQKDRERLRIELNAMHEEINGLKRQISQYSADRMILLEGNGQSPSNTAPEASKSAERVKRIVRDEGDNL